MSDLTKRVIGTLYFLPLVLGTLAGQPWLLLVMIGLQIMMCLELARIFSISDGAITRYQIALSVPVLASHLAVHDISFGLSPVLMITIITALSVFFLVGTRDLFAALFGLVVIICLMSLSWLITLPDAVMIIVALALMITACDIAAYFVGRFIGGPKLAPAISPGKTISGGIGGLLGAVITALCVSPYLPVFGTDVVLAALIVGVMAQSGDLYESAFKRRVGIKDSGSFIPGHGGFLDRFDGYLFVLPVSALLIASNTF